MIGERSDTEVTALNDQVTTLPTYLEKLAERRSAGGGNQLVMRLAHGGLAVGPVSHGDAGAPGRRR